MTSLPAQFVILQNARHVRVQQLHVHLALLARAYIFINQHAWLIVKHNLCQALQTLIKEYVWHVVKIVLIALMQHFVIKKNANGI